MSNYPGVSDNDLLKLGAELYAQCQRLSHQLKTFGNCPDECSGSGLCTACMLEPQYIELNEQYHSVMDELAYRNHESSEVD